jgi:peroxiredoxin (alkyl hydroperoxide reductase subunit C)
MDKFRALGVEVVAVSIDSQLTHSAWCNTPVNDGGIGAESCTMAAMETTSLRVIAAIDIEPVPDDHSRSTYRHHQ